MIDHGDVERKELESAVCGECGISEASLRDTRLCPKAARDILVIFSKQVDTATVANDVPDSGKIVLPLKTGGSVTVTKGDVDFAFESTQSTIEADIGQCVSSKVIHDVSGLLGELQGDFEPSRTYTDDDILILLGNAVPPAN